MGRNQHTQKAQERVAPRDPSRRCLITVGLPALGTLGAAGLLHSGQAVGTTAEKPAPSDPDGSELTPHRAAYYRRARF